ncbi:MAG: hypothetical protein L6Q29_01940 [Candidatus Pacebacteria bacterium]|nr:hypothetical protein [Candidatus Paceibacterota bacterium]
MTIDRLALMVGKGFNEVHDKLNVMDGRLDSMDERFEYLGNRVNLNY